MKRVINGLLYNTETANKIHQWDNGYYSNDFKAREKTLYKTKNGAYFLEHQGGAMTDMSVPCGNNSRSGSCSIEPICIEDTIAFLESHDGTDVLIEHFPKYIQNA